MPQFFQVLTDRLSLVGNRPLPENVIKALRTDYTYAEDRFLVRGGMTGPVQLVGRDYLSDEDRLRLEIMYCEICRNGYSPMLDFLILFYTVLIGVRIRQTFSIEELYNLIFEHSNMTVSQSTMIKSVDQDHDLPSNGNSKAEIEAQPISLISAS